MLYLHSLRRFILISLTLLGLSVSPVNASTIVGGDLLDQAGASHLETWLGIGNQTFTNIFDGTTGATATSWHSAVDGFVDTISIYDITYNNNNYLIGGYRNTAWASSNAYASDPLAFIFNLTTPSMLDQSPSWNNGSYSIYDGALYFATFGAGHDLYGGNRSLGSGYVRGGFSYGAAGIFNPGPADLLGNHNNTNQSFSVNGLETYTLSAINPVPIPAAVWLFGTALIGFVGFGKRRKSA